MKILIYRIVEKQKYANVKYSIVLKNQQKNSEVEDSIQKQKKVNNGLKFKNNKGPISVFICYCSNPR